MSVNDAELDLDQSGPDLPPRVADPTARSTWRRRHRTFDALTRGKGLVGVLLLAAVATLGIVGPWLTAWDPIEQLPGSQLLPPGDGHFLGTDALSRDIWSRTLTGIRTSLTVSLLAVPLAAIAGIIIGLLATAHGITDVITQRVFDIVLAFPALILGITLAAIIGPGLWTVVWVIAISEAPIFGRLVRSSVLKVRELPFVESAQVIGASNLWVLRRHILPNVLEPVAVQIALAMSVAVFVESSMSFIGVGVRPPTPSLGSVVADSLIYLSTNPWFAVGPLLVIAALTLGFLLVAQALGRSRRG